MNMHFEYGTTADSVEIEVTTCVEKPKIEIANWPKFTVIWMGTKIEGRFISPGVYQIGNAVVFRNAEGEYVELAPKVYAKWLEDK